MPIPREESEVTQEALPVAKPRLSIVVVLAMLLGVLLTVLVASAYFNYQRITALQDEVLVTQSALKGKSQAVEEMKTQIEALSRQMDHLKEYSVARSVTERANKSDKVAPAVAAEAPKPESGKAEKPTPAPSVPEKVKKPKPESPNCELVGKSAQEQAETLKRCVDLMDSTGAKK